MLRWRGSITCVLYVGQAYRFGIDHIKSCFDQTLQVRVGRRMSGDIGGVSC